MSVKRKVTVPFGKVDMVFRNAPLEKVLEL